MTSREPSAGSLPAGLGMAVLLANSGTRSMSWAGNLNQNFNRDSPAPFRWQENFPSFLSLQTALQRVMGLHLADFLGNLIPDCRILDFSRFAQGACMAEGGDEGIRAMKGPKVAGHGSHFRLFQQ